MTVPQMSDIWLVYYPIQSMIQRSSSHYGNQANI